MAYVFTASKASSVRLACKAHFLALSIESLITVSSNIIHIHQAHSLTPTHEITCYGRISTITPFKYYESKLDQLFITTEDHKYFTLSYVDGQVTTSTTGDISSAGLSTPEMGHRVYASDHYIFLYLYNGIVSVIPIHQAANPKKRAADGNRLIGVPQQMRLSQYKIHCIALVDGSAGGNAFGVLYRDSNLNTQFMTYEVHVRKGELELRKGALVMSNLEDGTNIIISRRGAGVCCVGESTLYTRAPGTNQMEYPIATPTLFNSFTRMGEDVWVLGDDYGLLYNLSFPVSAPELRQIPLPKSVDTQLSPISIPHVLVALEEELFLGSHFGDSQLLALPSLQIMASKINIGPIQDILVEYPKGAGGSSSLITASGAYKDGAMRLVKYGVGMAEKAELEIENIRGVWGIDELSIIVIGFVDGYIVLQVSGDGQIEQLEAGEDELLYACCLRQKLILVKHHEIIISADAVHLGTQKMNKITAAKLYDGSLVLVNDGNLELHTFNGEQFEVAHSKTFDHEISAFEVAHNTVIVSFWDTDSLWIGDTEFNAKSEEKLESTSTVHSMILHNLSNMPLPTLLVAMNDGSLLSYAFEPQARHPTNRKESVLGTTPISLHLFTTKQGPNVFAVCDRPTIIHSTRSKLAFSNISIPSCTYFAAFNSQILQSCMIIATENGLRIGGIEDIQKLQYGSAPLGELPRRLVKTAGVIGALTMRMEVELITGNETQISCLKIFDPDTYDKLDEYELQGNEMCQSICSITIDGTERIVVGTSFSEDDQDECKRGRIMVFGVHETDRTLWMMVQVEVPGSVYCLASIGFQLVAGVNSFVRLFDISIESMKELHSFRSSTFAITIAVRDDTVLIGDLMKSFLYLRVKDAELQEIARDYVPTWTTAVQYCDEETFVGAEADGNLILLTEADSPLPENAMRLSRVGEFRYGEMVNRIVSGTFIVPEDTSIVHPCNLFGTVDGSIGCIGTIHTDYINFLLQLQTNIATCRPTVGGLSHAEFRGYKAAGTRNLEPVRFVDGDLIEEYLELTQEQKEKVCMGLDKTAVEVEKIVEILARLR